MRLLFIVPYPALKEKVETVLSGVKDKTLPPSSIAEDLEATNAEKVADAKRINSGIHNKLTVSGEEASTENPPEPLQVDVKVWTVEEAENISDTDYDVIIARGLTAVKMRSISPSIPTIELKISVLDILLTLQESIVNRTYHKIGVISLHEDDEELDQLSALFSFAVQVYHVKNAEETRQAIVQAMSEGCEAIIGGYTAQIYANASHFPAYLIQSSAETILQALDEAVETTLRIRKEREIANMYKSIVYASNDGVLYVSRDGIIRVRNHVIREMNGNRSLLHRPLSEACPYLTAIFEETLHSMEEVNGKVVKIPKLNRTVSVSTKVVEVKGRMYGVVITLGDITRIQKLESEIRHKLSERGLKAKYQFEDILFQSEVMQQTIIEAKRYAVSDSNLIIIGETGTGKELFAQSIHQNSERKSGPFVAINCASLPETLLESELFGYKDGAFTGAKKGGKAGLFEEAHGGTLFLDEVSEISLATQAKLLRVIQEKEIRRIGDSRVIPIDVRIISATNRSLRHLIEDGKFRRDLMFRLDILRLFIPPLRDRRVDIPILFRTFFMEQKKISSEEYYLDNAAQEELTHYPFYGNIRELRNIAERMSVFSSDGYCRLEDMQRALYPKDLGDSNSATIPLMDYLPDEKSFASSEAQNLFDDKKDERFRILTALKQASGNREQAAKMLGMHRSTLWRKMKKYGWETKEW